MNSRAIVKPFPGWPDPEAVAHQLLNVPGLVLLHSDSDPSSTARQGRYSFVVAEPFLTFRSFGSRCETRAGDESRVQFGNPWHLLDGLMARYEILDEPDVPFPLGGCFGFWGYDLKNFVEPRLARRAQNDLELPDCQVGFYDSVVAWDHHDGTTWIIATGLSPDGSRDACRAQRAYERWVRRLSGCSIADGSHETSEPRAPQSSPVEITSNVTRAEFISAVNRGQRYIRSGDIYQVNLSHRLSAPIHLDAWDLFLRLSATSPAPFAAFLNYNEFQIASSSPEQFLRLSGAHVRTRPIKGTRPRSTDPVRDAQLSYELQTSAKEMSELVMITDLLRNDLGKVCEYGSVTVPDLARLEKFAHVQHLVSTVDGRLRSGVTHFSGLASCFPGGSITGAPKIRAMEIIDELEPVSRGPYTGALGYLGFNRESQLSIIIRTAVVRDGRAHFNVGAGIVADSDPAAEYEETLAKGAGFAAALNFPHRHRVRSS